MVVRVQCCFTSTETVWASYHKGREAQDIHLDFHTAPERRWFEFSVALRPQKPYHLRGVFFPPVYLSARSFPFTLTFGSTTKAKKPAHLNESTSYNYTFKVTEHGAGVDGAASRTRTSRRSAGSNSVKHCFHQQTPGASRRRCPV